MTLLFFRKKLSENFIFVYIKNPKRIKKIYTLTSTSVRAYNNVYVSMFLLENPIYATMQFPK